MVIEILPNLDIVWQKNIVWDYMEIKLGKINTAFINVEQYI